MKIIRNYIHYVALISSFVFLGMGSINAQIEKGLFQKLPVDIGLNNTSVTDIVQDDRGYLWIATWVGLYRYDGNSAKLYKSEGIKSNGLNSNKIGKLLLSKSGELYIGTIRGSVFRYRYDTDDFTQISEKSKNVLRSNVWSLFEDRLGQIWIGTEKGLSIYDPQSGEMGNKDVFLKSSVNSKRVHFIGDADSDYVWVGTDHGVFVYYLESSGHIHEMGHYSFHFQGFTEEESNFISFIWPDYAQRDQVLITCKSGIVHFDYSNGFQDVLYHLTLATNENFLFPRKIFKSSFYPEGYLLASNDGLRKYTKNGKLEEEVYIDDKIVKVIFEDSFGSLWVGTESGLYKLNNFELFIRNISFSPANRNDLDVPEVITRSVYSNDIWFGWQSGVISNLKSNSDFQSIENVSHKYLLSPEGEQLKNRISQIEVDREGNLWIATQGGGLLSFYEKNFDIKKEGVTPDLIIDHDDNLKDDYLMSLCLTDNKVVIGTWNAGLFSYDIAEKEVNPIRVSSGSDVDLRNTPLVQMLLITYEGMDLLIIGTRGEGVYITNYNKQNNEIKILKHLYLEEDRSMSLSSNFITHLSSEKNTILIASEGGFNRFDLKEMDLIKDDFSEYLNDYVLQTVILSEDSSYWFSTFKSGLIEVFKQNEGYQIKHYKEGALGNYGSASGINIEKNSFLYGGSGGYTLVNQEYKIKNQKAPIPLISDFRINNISIKDLEEKGRVDIMDKVIEELPDINLRHQDKVITFVVNAMQTNEKQGMTYAYKLEDFNKEWIYSSEDEKMIHFTNLPYKDFVFKFKAANANGLWSDEIILKLSISPPFWFSPIAYIIYFILFGFIVVFIFQYQLVRAKYKQNLELERIERKKSEELNQLKLNFYTSISHELRTPLTMIVTPIQQLMDDKAKVDVKKSYEFIYKNANKLLILINQLLDFRKHELKKVKVNFERKDIIRFSREVVMTFNDLAYSKKIKLEFESNVASLFMVFDGIELEKMFNNLISNSLKFTPSGGRISVKLEEAEGNKLIIKVEDSGKGISSKDIKYIFDRFYQAKDSLDKGYGLGLSIIKSIVDLHSGEIEVKSKLKEGTVFTISLPTDLVIEEKTEAKENRIENDRENILLSEIAPEQQNERKKLLVVEDDEDIKNFIKENLKNEFDVALASNGEEGFDTALAEVPDLIISDIAMPKKDGFELCKDLKANMVTSHIPIVLLTARTSTEYKLNAYDLGISGYVTKPFNLELLKSRINSILDHETVLKEKFKSEFNQNGFLFPKIAKEDSMEAKFLNNVKKHILEKLGESELTVEELAMDMRMSKVQFYRKMKALTDQTPNAFIRELRLHKAAELLLNSEFNVSEITYQVGFNDLKYFRKIFKDRFDMNPSEFKRSSKNRN